jgi:hypothetical protein
MGNQAKKIIVCFLVVAFITLPAASALAGSDFMDGNPSAGAMAADILVVRPLGLVALIGGGAIFLVSLPFSTVGGNVEDAKQKLVAEPADFFFNRPLGRF